MSYDLKADPDSDTVAIPTAMEFMPNVRLFDKLKRQDTSVASKAPSQTCLRVIDYVHQIGIREWLGALNPSSANNRKRTGWDMRISTDSSLSVNAV
jgi:hypothetical protein